MRVSTCDSIDALPAAAWNRLAGEENPFVRHEFLAALEHHGCVGDEFGWWPQHIVAHTDDGTLLGAVPMYIKDNSYGEFVFDWAWAEAYQRAGLPYYPKLVSATPYTPATGPRLMTADEADAGAVSAALIGHALAQVKARQMSSLHWLFTSEAETRQLEDHGLMRRMGCQFHWHNPGYRDFEDFLDGFTSAKRKKIRRERRHVEEAGIELRVVHGHEASDDQWRIASEFYRSTFDRKWGTATLNLEFFRELGRTMGDRVVLVFAYHQNRPVAAAIDLRGKSALYGRHWGCTAEFHSLHFEACYYQGIDYCIRNGLSRFEPGAQGEHKISRGFVPTATWSAHWIADDRFRVAIKDFLKREQRGMQDYMRELNEHLPYKHSAPVPSQVAQAL